MGYYPAIPEIAAAFQNDPSNLLAAKMMNTGSSGAPVAAGKYAWMDGLARALQGVVGGYVQRRENKEYKQKEQELMDLYAQALGGGNAAAAQEGGGIAPPQQGASAASAAPNQPPSPQTVPPAPQMAPQAPDPLAPLPDSPAAAIAAALAGPKAPVAGPQGMAAINGMVPITAMAESANHDFKPNGAPVTSPKGAKYAMQVMPGTAGNPGYGVKPAKGDTAAEYDRVGRDYLDALMKKYGGDPAKAWGAYNWGPGHLDKALAKHGENWLSHAPSDTQKYVRENLAKAGYGPADTSKPYYADADATAPTPPVSYQTPEPELPPAPERPAARPAPSSLKLTAGQKLMRSGNPFAYANALRLTEEGMGEQYMGDREALNSERDLDRAGYDSELNNRNSAESQKRAGAYDARNAERGEQYAYGRETRGYAHDDNTNAANRQFQSSERTGQQQFEASENEKNRAQQEKLTRMTIEGKHEDTQTRLNAKMQNFLSTPGGARMYKESTDTMNANDNINNQIDQFMELNSKHDTGGMLMNMPTGAGEWFARNMNSDTQAMDSITHNIAPLMRKAGQGSMSDRDLEMFERAVPNIRATREANTKGATRLKAGIKRMNDFELEKIAAAAEGRQVEFLREWSIYKSRVPFTSDISFSDWKASVPQFDATGKRK